VSEAVSETKILGIDPGTRVAGYGVVAITPSGTLRAVSVGAWRLDEKQSLAARLAMLAIEFRRVVALHKPDIVCVELPFVSNNARSALVLGTARGVILSESYQCGLGIAEIAATSAKKTITGNGYAEKERVMRTLQALLKADLSELPYDATDALAIAYAHAMRMRSDSILNSGKAADVGRNAVLQEWAESRKRGKLSMKSFARTLVSSRGSES
jgi:crossover junction endodeoxyribonuclease RuvC